MTDNNVQETILEEVDAWRDGSKKQDPEIAKHLEAIWDILVKKYDLCYTCGYEGCSTWCPRKDGSNGR